jgi:hypothetical protein
MTAKEPRPGSHFRLVLQGIQVQGAPLARVDPAEQLIFPVIGPQSEVRPFPVETSGPAEQDAVDRVSAKVQALYDSLPEDEKAVLGQILGQAAAYAWEVTE